MGKQTYPAVNSADLLNRDRGSVTKDQATDTELGLILALMEAAKTQASRLSTVLNASSALEEHLARPEVLKALDPLAQINLYSLLSRNQHIMFTQIKTVAQQLDWPSLSVRLHDLNNKTDEVNSEETADMQIAASQMLNQLVKLSSTHNGEEVEEAEFEEAPIEQPSEESGEQAQQLLVDGDIVLPDDESNSDDAVYDDVIDSFTYEDKDYYLLRTSDGDYYVEDPYGSFHDVPPDMPKERFVKFRNQVAQGRPYTICVDELTDPETKPVFAGKNNAR